MSVLDPTTRSRSVRRLLFVWGLVWGSGLLGCSSDQPSARQTSAEIEAEDPAKAIAFTDVTERAGLGAFRHQTGSFGQKWFPETFGAGCAFLDYDGDGWLDVLLVGGGNLPGQSQTDVRALWLYRNNGDPGSGPGQAPTFTDVTAEAGLADVKAYGFGLTTADYDNDGDEDVYFTTLRENLLLRNDGGTFTDVTSTAGVAGEPEWSSSALFFDADRDGLLDLYVGGYAAWSPETDVRCTVGEGVRSYCAPTLYESVLSRFYHNDGAPVSDPRRTSTFVDRTVEAGFGDAPGKTFGVAELDFNRDGWSDLFVANDLQRDLLYRNDGRPGLAESGVPAFTERGMASGVAFDENGLARGGMGVDVGVVDTTGEPTVFVGNFSNEMIGVYRHLRDGLFLDRAALSKIGRPSLPTLTFGLFLFDAELDGDLDLFAANGHVFDHVDQTQDGVTYRQAAQLFLSRRDGTFREAIPDPAGALPQPLIARGAAYGDYDRDGDLDVLLTENGGPAHLWRNDSARGHYLRVSLEGRESNRSALGSRVVAYADGAGQERRVRAGSSYLSQSEKAVTFGFGETAQVDSLAVYWPSGLRQRFGPLATDQHIRIVEGEGAVENAVPAGAPVAKR